MIQTYINYMTQVRAMSPRTCEEYEKELRAWARWASPRGLRWSTTTREDIENHVRTLTARGLKPATIKKRVTALRGLYAYMEHRHMIEQNPARYIQTPRILDTLPTTTDVRKVDEYLNATPIDAADIDVKLATALMLEAGLRLDETIRLERGDIDTTQRAIRVKGKGGKERITFYGQRTAKLLYENRRWRQGRILDIELGTTLRWAMYKYAGKYAKRIHPHELRHTFACEKLNAGMSLKTLSQLMGHASTATTERYARMSIETLKREYNQTNI